MNLRLIADEVLDEMSSETAFSDTLDSIEGAVMDANLSIRGDVIRQNMAKKSGLQPAKSNMSLAQQIVNHKEKCKARPGNCPFEKEKAKEAEAMGISPAAIGLPEYDKQNKTAEKADYDIEKGSEASKTAQISPNFSIMRSAKEKLNQAEQEKDKNPNEYAKALEEYDNARESYLNDALGSKEVEAIKRMCDKNVIARGIDKIRAFVSNVGNFLTRDKNSVSHAQATATSMIASAAGIETPKSVLEAIGEEPKPAESLTGTKTELSEGVKENHSAPNRTQETQQRIDSARKETGDSTWNSSMNYMGSSANGTTFRIRDDETGEPKEILKKGDDGKYYALDDNKNPTGEGMDLEEAAAYAHEEDVKFNNENKQKRQNDASEKATSPEAQINRILADYKKEESEIMERHKDDKDGGVELTRELTEAKTKRDKEIKKNDPVEKGENGKKETAEEHAKHCKANPKSNCPFLKQHMTKEQLAELDKQAEETTSESGLTTGDVGAGESGNIQYKAGATGATEEVGEGATGGSGVTEQTTEATSGATEQQGETGTTGTVGATGESGTTGQTGNIGATGESGDTGGKPENEKSMYQNLGDIVLPKKLDDMTKEELTDKKKSIKEELRQLKRNGASQGDIDAKKKEYLELGERIANYKEKVTNETLERDMDNAEKALDDAKAKLEEIKNKPDATQEEIDAAQKAVDDAEEAYDDAEEAWMDGPNAPKKEEKEEEEQEEDHQMTMKELNAAFSEAGITAKDIKAIQNLSNYPPEFIADNIGAFRDVLSKANRFNELQSTEPKFDDYLKALKESGFNSALNFGVIDNLDEKAKSADDIDDRLVIEAARDAIMSGKDTQKILDQMHKTLNANKKARQADDKAYNEEVRKQETHELKKQIDEAKKKDSEAKARISEANAKVKEAEAEFAEANAKANNEKKISEAQIKVEKARYAAEDAKNQSQMLALRREMLENKLKGVGEANEKVEKMKKSFGMKDKFNRLTDIVENIGNDDDKNLLEKVKAEFEAADTLSKVGSAYSNYMRLKNQLEDKQRADDARQREERGIQSREDEINKHSETFDDGYGDPDGFDDSEVSNEARSYAEKVGELQDRLISNEDPMTHEEFKKELQKLDDEFEKNGFTPPSRRKPIDKGEGMDDYNTDTIFKEEDAQKSAKAAMAQAAAGAIEAVMQGEPTGEIDQNGNPIYKGGIPGAKVEEVKDGELSSTVTLSLPINVKPEQIEGYVNKLSSMLGSSVSFQPMVRGEENRVQFTITHNKQDLHSLHEAMNDKKVKESMRKMTLPMLWGRDNNGEYSVLDLASGAPHAFLAGMTGQGKSILAKNILMGWLMKSPKLVRPVVIDPKGVDFQDCKGIKGVGYADGDNLTTMLESLKRQMERRQKILKKSGCANIADFNALHPDKPMPYIPVIFDEITQAVQNEHYGPQVKQYLEELSRLSRFTGIHIMGMTQTGTADALPTAFKSQLGKRASLKQDSQSKAASVFENNKEAVASTMRLPGPGACVIMGEDGQPKVIQAPTPSDLMDGGEQKNRKDGDFQRVLRARKRNASKYANQVPKNPLDNEKVGQTKQEEQAGRTKSGKIAKEESDTRSESLSFSELSKRNGMEKKETAEETFKTFKPSSDSLSDAEVFNEIKDAYDAINSEFGGHGVDANTASEHINGLFAKKYENNPEAQKAIGKIAEKVATGGYDNEDEMKADWDELTKSTLQQKNNTVSQNKIFAKHGIPDEGTIEERMSQFKPSKEGLNLYDTFSEMSDVISEMKKNGASDEDEKKARQAAADKIVENLPKDNKAINHIIRDIKSGKCSIPNKLTLLDAMLKKK